MSEQAAPAVQEPALSSAGLLVVCASVIVAGAVFVRATDVASRHPDAPAASVAALRQALSGPEAASSELSVLRTRVERALRPWRPERLRVERAGYDGQEVAVTAVVESAPGGYLGFDRPEHGCLAARTRGGRVDAWAAWRESCEEPVADVDVPGPILEKRIGNVTESLRAALGAFAEPHPPISFGALRAALATVPRPADAAIESAENGDVGVSITMGSLHLGESECVLAWLGSAGGVEVWNSKVSDCGPKTALRYAPPGPPLPTGEALVPPVEGRPA